MADIFIEMTGEKSKRKTARSAAKLKDDAATLGCPARPYPSRAFLLRQTRQRQENPSYSYMYTSSSKFLGKPLPRICERAAVHHATFSPSDQQTLSARPLLRGASLPPLHNSPASTANPETSRPPPQEAHEGRKHSSGDTTAMD